MSVSKKTSKQSHILIVGASAYDQLCLTQFCHSDIHLNDKLLQLTQHFGGCGANIAYNLAQHSIAGTLLTHSGAQDDQELLRHWDRYCIASSACLRRSGQNTARAIVLSDPTGEQLTYFYPGAELSKHEWQNHLDTLSSPTAPIKFYVQAPFPADLSIASMDWVMNHFPDALRFWCPGQYVDHMDLESISYMVCRAHLLIGNQQEMSRLREHQATTGQDISGKVLVESRGSGPIHLTLANGEQLQHKIPNISNPVDPTGCGDALIAGIIAFMSKHNIHNIEHLLTEQWRPILDAGVALAQQCLVHNGAQHH
ncbi:MAG: carbohydrate kinase family protein [Gammaproteobacteria bacterium]|nr:carbohydrate kinase family protein [Gammaproteobacteria bacterium]